jgi:Putative rhamnosyl transferase
MSIWVDSIYHPWEKLEAPVYHAVLTRYNVVIKRTENPGKSRERRRWLDERLQLFEAFCLPSMLNQTKRPDLWLLAMDGHSREAVQPVLDAIRGHPWIVPAWQSRIDGIYEEHSRVFAREVIARLPAGTTHIITTRVDNDDAINATFLEYLQSYSASVLHKQPDVDDFWLVFPVGADYLNGRCRMYVCPINAFCSRVQKVNAFLDDRQTVYATQHARLFAEGHKVFLPITPEPMWIRNFHGNNLSYASMADRRNFTASATRTVLRQCGVKLDQEPEPLWPNAIRLGREGRRSRRRIAKLLLRSAGLMKPKPAAESK